MITLFLVVLASFFKSVADTLAHHFDTSVFKNKNPLVWNPNTSQVKKWWITGYKIDPWHVCNSLMIVSLILAATIHRYDKIILNWLIELLILGVVWNIVFNLFYSKLLRKTK